MKEKELEDKLKKLNWKEPDRAKMERHKETFKATLISAARKANENEKKRRKRRFAFAYSAIALIIIFSTLFVNNFIQRRAFYEIVTSNPTEIFFYKYIAAPHWYHIKIRKIVKDRNIGVAYVYVNVQGSVLVVRLEDKSVIGVGAALSMGRYLPYCIDSKSRGITISEKDKNIAKSIALNDDFIKNLKIRLVTVSDSTIVYSFKGSNLSNVKVGKVYVTTKTGETITVFVDIANRTVLDITGMENVLGEFISPATNLHYFVYMPMHTKR